MSRTRNWVFTINNFSDVEQEACQKLECSYIVVGTEVGASGTPHLQGYVEFANAKTMTAVKKLLGGRAHLEPRKGTPLQASDYCKKDGMFTERGNLSQQGKRSDLHEVADLVRERGIEGVIDEVPHMFIKYAKGIERLNELYMKPRTEKPKVVWLWGQSGVGKTREAFNVPEDMTVYSWNQTKWWNGYAQQFRIVIDDFTFDGSDSSFRYLLKLLDRYHLKVETKGGMVEINSPEIYITSEFPPNNWFKEGNSLNQVLRRLDEVTEVIKTTDANYDDEIINDDSTNQKNASSASAGRCYQS